MDEYTRMTRQWLDERYRRTDHQGIYFAHQPIYGFRMGHSEKSLLHRYTITYHIIQALSHLKFESLVDVGGAEGYKGAAIRCFFDTIVKSCDLSSEACKRAEEIYNLDTEVTDVRELPFESNSYDVVLCSEVLEHVPDFHAAMDQLIRVAKKAVVITLPHESRRHVRKHLDEPHTHLCNYRLSACDYLESRGMRVIRKRMNNHFVKVLGVIAEAMPRHHEGLRSLSYVFNKSLPILRFLFGKRTFEALICLDAFVSRLSFYNSMLFVILKDPNDYSRLPLRRISSRQLLEFSVPFHYIRGEG